MWRGAIVFFVIAAASSGAQGAVEQRHCLRATRTLPAASIPVATDFVEAECAASAPRPALRYDLRKQVELTTRELQAGEVVAGVPAFALASIRPGQKLYIRTQVGPVVIQREVEAIQPARKGRPLFVRAADGAVFAIPFPEDLR